ncbi:hypothetical protein HC891_22280 [Candidatus Gracilibacteria bacterium]|nr:hypothetical protein [Candidatus Gracilibacteria bacterium]
MAEEPTRWNVYDNTAVGATRNPLITDPDAIDEEAHFVKFVAIVSQALEALWEVRNLRKE